MRLDHLNLRVRDPGACRRFYVDHFGCTDAFEAEGGWFLRDGGGFLLALVPRSEPDGLPAGTHVGFGLRRAQDVADQHRALEVAGVATTPLEDHRPDEDYVTFRCWDPDGTEVEVYWDASRGA